MIVDRRRRPYGILAALALACLPVATAAQQSTYR